MNAAEARAKSKANLPKLVDECVKAGVIMINSSIQEAVAKGHQSTKANIWAPLSVVDEVTEKLIAHFEGLGYRVEAQTHFNSKVLQIGWSE